MANYSNKDILKAFKEINRRIDDLWCYIKECCAKVPRNIGNGEGIYKMFYNDKWQFKSLLAGDNISITSQDDTITITSTVEPIDCEDINDCLGISEEGQPNKFLNEQGDFVTVSGFTCSDLSTCSTTNLPEGSNLYFTNPRAVSALTGQNISIFNNNAGYITGVTESPNRVAYFDNNGDLKTNSNFVYNETSNLFTAALPIPGGFYQLSSGGSKIGAGDVSSPDSYIQITPSSISWSFPLLSSDVFFFPYNDGNSGDVMTTDGNGSLTLQPIPAGFTCSDLIGCNISNLTNDSGYITSSALSPYLTSTTAALTYEPLLGFTPENVSNKTDVMSGNTTSSTKYLSAKGVYDWVIGLGYQLVGVSTDAYNALSLGTDSKPYLKKQFQLSGNTYSEIYDDYSGQLITGGLSYTPIGHSTFTGTFSNSAIVSANGIGVVRNTTATAAESFIYFASSLTVGRGETYFECYAKTPTLINSTNRCTIMYGYRAGATAVFGLNAIYFRRVDNVNSGNWQIVCRQNDTETVQNLSIAPSADTWYRFTIIINAAGTSVSFYIDGVQVGTAITTNIPTAVISATIVHNRSAGSASVTWDADYMYQRVDFTTPR